MTVKSYPRLIILVGTTFVLIMLTFILISLTTATPINLS
jgi:hypothetical protein